MHKNSLTRSTFDELMQKIKAPQHSRRFRNKQNNERIGRIQLPSLPRQKSRRNDDSILSMGNSGATSVSWSEDVENVATHKLEEQWTNVESSLYEEDNQLPSGAVLSECIQWRTQIPYLRIIGKNLSYTENNVAQSGIGLSGKKNKRLQNDEILMEHSLVVKEKEEEEEEEEKKDFTQYKFHKTMFEDIFDILMEYVISELYLNKENDNDTDSLCESSNDTPKIASTVRGSDSSRISKTSWAEEVISPNYIENKSLNIRNRLLDTDDNHVETIKNYANHRGIRKKKRNTISAKKQRDFSTSGEDDVMISKERLRTTHVVRNRLGTVFSEKIVVNPVPFAVSTRESFSTLKTMPIRFISGNPEMLSFQELSGNISDFRNPTRKSILRNSNIHSAWQSPVCPTVWPKNIRLAPIDTSRLPSSKNRSLAPSPVVVHCNRKPLNPISRSTIPKSAHVICNHDDLLEIQGKHIVPVPSPKINMLSTGWDYSPRIVKGKKKRDVSKEGF